MFILRHAVKTTPPLSSTKGLAPVATATAPATCGELVQGVLGGQDFLINCPINLYSKVEVTLGLPTGKITVTTPGVYSKVRQAVRMALTLCAPFQSADIEIHSSIARGKGLASSTSEITAAIAATAAAAHAELDAESISDIAINVEPSDGVYFPGVVRYDQIRGRLLDTYGEPPPLKFILVDTGGAIDTLDFDREKFRRNANDREPELREAVRRIALGFLHGSSTLVAEGATLSARCNQAVLLKPELETLIAGTRDLGGLGVNCAHTGTVLGVMFNPFDTSEERLVKCVAELVGPEKIIGCHTLISGGARIV